MTASNAGTSGDEPSGTASPESTPRRAPRLRARSLVLLLTVCITVGGLLVGGTWLRVAGTGTSQAVRANPDLVVLVHGLGRSRFSMMPLEWALEAEGYRVLNWGYSSTCCSIGELAEQLAEDLEGQTPRPGGELHFVGHSLGNIVVRTMLAESRPQALGRVVMLAPPNQGSRAASRFLPVLGWLYPPLAELVPAPSSTVHTVTLPASVEVGVIAGEHDGKVSVAESHLPGERDHAVVPSAHTFIMVREDVRQLITSFLELGNFPDA